nr:hypothetical protein [Flavobacterium sp. ASV13]
MKHYINIRSTDVTGRFRMLCSSGKNENDNIILNKNAAQNIWNIFFGSRKHKKMAII